MKKTTSLLTTGTEKYPALTGIRACGAIAVFVDHFQPSTSVHTSFNVMAFFFVLSGFLIVRLYYDKLRPDGHWLAGYFVRRFARIYPVYFLLVTIAIGLHFHQRPLPPHPSFNLWMLIKNYTLTHALFHQWADVLIQPSWTLTVEECFYLLAPVFILVIRRAGYVVGLLSAVVMLGVALAVSTTGISFLGTPEFVWGSTFFGHFFEFFSGIGLALVIMRLERNGVAAKQGVGGGQGNSWTMAGGAGVLVLVAVMIFMYGHPPVNNAAIILVNNFLIPVPVAVLYFGLIRENTAVSRVLSGRVATLLGRSSYSFYLLHTLVIDYFSVPRLPTLFGGHRVLAVLLTLIMTWLLSICLFKFYEEPINLWIRKVFIPKNKPVAA
jgi:peptidoglycan/LPS O-acetylase OafA/YrhL